MVAYSKNIGLSGKILNDFPCLMKILIKILRKIEGSFFYGPNPKHKSNAISAKITIVVVCSKKFWFYVVSSKILNDFCEEKFQIFDF